MILRREFLWCTAISTLLASCPAIGLAKDKDDGPAGGKTQAGQPQLWPSYEKVESLLRGWQREHPAVMKLDVVAKSAEDRAVYVARLTDPTADDADKEHVLLTGLHSGVERTGTTCLLRVVQWLLSGDRLSQETLKRQVITVAPMVNPDGYVRGMHRNTRGQEPYSGWTLDGPKNPSDCPEAVAVQRLMDQCQPEVFMDYHGLDLAIPGCMMVETSGPSFSNFALRPYHRDILRVMDEAALVGGFPSHTLEDDAEQILWGPDLNPINYKVWPGRPRPYAAIYCYSRYHTLILAAELVWERSALLRTRRLLQIGNETWPSEYYAGYPTRVASMCYGDSGHAIVAYGRTAAARRRSRVELWNKQDQFVHGPVRPRVEGMGLYVCATTHAAAAKWLIGRTLADFARSIRNHPEMDSGPILRLIERHPDQAWQDGDHADFRLRGGGKGDAVVEHGLALRVRIPYASARVTDLRLNGRPVVPSETDGYLTWRARGFTYVQINVPPEESKRCDLFVVTWEYDPGSKRTQGWQGWGDADD